MAVPQLERKVLMDNPFRKYRTQMGWTIEQCIEEIPGCNTRETWRKWEHGIMPNDANLQDLATSMELPDSAALYDAIMEWRVKHEIEQHYPEYDHEAVA